MRFPRRPRRACSCYLAVHGGCSPIAPPYQRRRLRGSGANQTRGIACRHHLPQPLDPNGVFLTRCPPTAQDTTSALRGTTAKAATAQPLTSHPKEQAHRTPTAASALPASQRPASYSLSRLESVNFLMVCERSKPQRTLRCTQCQSARLAGWGRQRHDSPISS